MRRAKSNPAKYAKNYTSISQRRMSTHDEADEDVELERIKELLKTKSVDISNSYQEDTHKRKRTNESQQNNILVEEEAELYYTTDDVTLILPAKKKKEIKVNSNQIELTPEEIKTAKLEHKKMSRKLQQLEQRRATKDRRVELYKTLENHALTKEEATLMTPSATLGRQRLTKKEMLMKLLRMERAGVSLTDEQKEMLYTSTLAGYEEEEEKEIATLDLIRTESLDWSQEKLSTSIMINSSSQTTDNEAAIPLSFPSSGKQQEKKNRKKILHENIGDINPDRSINQCTQPEKKLVSETITTQADAIIEIPKPTIQYNESVKFTTQQMFASLQCLKSQTDCKETKKKKTLSQEVETCLTDVVVTNFSSATYSKKTHSSSESKIDGKCTLCDNGDLETSEQVNIQRVPNTYPVLSDSQKSHAKYMSFPRPLNHEIVVKNQEKNMYPEHSGSVNHSSALFDLQNSNAQGTSDSSPQPCDGEVAVKKHAIKTYIWKAISVNRPTELLGMRNELPVVRMEYDIVDSVRNHAVTIICSDTGSGKSTQVPQFLYESGITSGSGSMTLDDDSTLMIGVTQPRRIAAITTAKRVCYEMGFSTDKGTTIKSNCDRKGNVVAYQTRYESAGIGDRTRIKFMTDGILLQEMKSDLLLRKYAVIVLDEAHERNLNTDIAVGLLNAAISLREKASEEGSLPPLKLVIMSATLRVEDFVGSRLFPSNPPNVVHVPGRTFPVSIHHSQTTELDKYEDIAFHKICRIHRKLPQGGILVFLTGQREIVRMVKRLKKALLIVNSELTSKGISNHEIDDYEDCKYNFEGPRDMDDDEVDADVFQDDADKGVSFQDDSIEPLNIVDDLDEMTEFKTESATHSCSPTEVLILPLFSLLSAPEQAKVFKPVPENTRLIVVATNVAETSITIPNIKYVVDTGRQKCRNYHPVTGIASYDIMWISQASADQRAGRAGRTSAGHCYRLYSASVYSRHFDPFSLPEVLVRPLEDVILMMKAMKISSISEFPFPTPPDSRQLEAATRLLANIGCIDTSQSHTDGGDGIITKLGEAVSKLPMGVRYGKMLIAASEAEVLDFGITVVAILSESCPFVRCGEETLDSCSEDSNSDCVESRTNGDHRNSAKVSGKNRWGHTGGDILSALLAVGAYSYALRGGYEADSSFAKRFCEENGLNPVIIQRIQRTRLHLSQLVRTRFILTGIAGKTGGVFNTKPPTKHEEKLLRQAIASALLDNVARRTILSSVAPDATNKSRLGYISCQSVIGEPLFMDPNSVLYSRDFRQLPEWVCYDHVVRKVTKDGRVITVMKNATPVDPLWLGSVAIDSNLLKVGLPLDVPNPRYDAERDAIHCFVTTKYGDHNWIINPIQIRMTDAVQRNPRNTVIQIDDCYRWFARALLEGMVIDKLKPLRNMLNDDVAIITRRKASSKVISLVLALSSAKVATLSSLRKYWKETNPKLLLNEVMSWIKVDHVREAKQLWIVTIKEQIMI